MKISTVTLTPNDAVLTCYLQDHQPQMPNTDCRPAMLVLPGGGYQYCSGREAEPVALAFLAEGYHAFVLHYTVGPDCPMDRALEDGTAAMAYLRANAQALGIRPDHIAAVGFSAGGHLAAALGTRLPAAQRPNALLLGYAATLGAMWAPMGREEPDLHTLVDDDTPPAFLFATQGDALVPVRNSLLFADALADRGIPFALHIFPTGAHGFSLSRPCTAGAEEVHNNPETAQWLPMSVSFLQKLWGFAPTAQPDPELARQMGAGALSLSMPTRQLMKNPQAAALLRQALGPMWEPLCANPLFLAVSLRSVAGFLDGAVPSEALDRLDEALSQLS